jgi:replication-associated recombination protein RarA
MGYYVHDQHPEFVDEMADDLQALVQAFLEEKDAIDVEEDHIPHLDEVSRFNQLQQQLFSQI